MLRTSFNSKNIFPLTLYCSTVRALGLGNALTLEHPEVIIDETLDTVEDE